MARLTEQRTRFTTHPVRRSAGDWIITGILIVGVLYTIGVLIRIW